MSSYQPNIPTGTVSLDVDYQNLRGNFQQLDTSFGVDHLPFSNATGQNGYHTVVHLIANSTVASNPPNNQPIVPPATAALTGEVFSAQINDSINTDTALYYQTAGGRLIQLTRNFAPVANTNGYTMLPGGLILQWGIVNSLSSTGTVTFAASNIAFPTSCYNVSCTLIAKAGGTSSANTIAPITGTVSSTGFQYSYTGTISYVAFYWQAIGI